MSLSIPGRVVVFDYGEVISRSPSAADGAVLVDLSGADPESFWSAYWAHREPLDHGTLSIPDYWAAVAQDLGMQWSLSRMHELWVADVRGWLSTDPGTVELMGMLRAAGTRVAILSNAGFDYGSVLRYSPAGRLAEQVFVSAELGLVKPDPEIYRVVARELGIEPAEMVFIDNKAANTDAAAALGIATHHFTGSDGLRAFLEGLAS